MSWYHNFLQFGTCPIQHHPLGCHTNRPPYQCRDLLWSSGGTSPEKLGHWRTGRGSFWNRSIYLEIYRWNRTLEMKVAVSLLVDAFLDSLSLNSWTENEETLFLLPGVLTFQFLKHDFKFWSHRPKANNEPTNEKQEKQPKHNKKSPTRSHHSS